MKQRLAISGLALSAMALVGFVTSEGWAPVATVPTKGDRPTVGFGSTFNPDGSPVKLGDRVDPVTALQRTMAHIQKDETAIKRCVTAPLHQAEYDLYADFVYQYGAATFCASSIARNLNRLDYRAACDSLLKYRFAAGYDCSTPGNRRCAGVWTRQLERHATCMAAQ